MENIKISLEAINSQKGIAEYLFSKGFVSKEPKDNTKSVLFDGSKNIDKPVFREVFQRYYLAKKGMSVIIKSFYISGEKTLKQVALQALNMQMPDEIYVKLKDALEAHVLFIGTGTFNPNYKGMNHEPYGDNQFYIYPGDAKKDHKIFQEIFKVNPEKANQFLSQYPFVAIKDLHTEISLATIALKERETISYEKELSGVKPIALSKLKKLIEYKLDVTKDFEPTHVKIDQIKKAFVNNIT